SGAWRRSFDSRARIAAGLRLARTRCVFQRRHSDPPAYARGTATRPAAFATKRYSGDSHFQSTFEPGAGRRGRGPAAQPHGLPCVESREPAGTRTIIGVDPANTQPRFGVVAGI